ncbi:MAG: LacI family DNA-binding transcriptional regulator, partial [Boseongicola sp.]|nr:LacI family DNA-binding transcriptional regulator [Boseongicola sp.]
PATAAKVKKAALELGYRPNPIARTMITGKSRIIGLLVAYLDNQFYPIALERLSAVLQERGYHILVFMAKNSTDGVEEIVQELLDYQVDGIIAASVAVNGDLADRCADAGIPVVLFNRGQDGSGLSTVTSANFEGGRKVADFLVSGEHKRIAHIAGWSGSSTGRDRSRGLKEGLADHGLEPTHVIDGMYNRDTAAEAARQLMTLSEPPDAIFVGNDHMAFAVMDAIRTDIGASIPQDVSIVGYDDVPLASWAAYDLTTVRQPVERMVEATVETLLGEINSIDRPGQKTAIEGPLIVRGSAKKPTGPSP